MGALTAKPKSLPTIHPTVVTLADTPAATTTTAPATGATPVTGETTGATTTMPGDGDAAAATRQGSLLERSRGLLSTVLTGFDGVLNNTATAARKSLLGE